MLIFRGSIEPKKRIGRLYTRGRIIRLDELSSVVRLERRTTEDSSSGRIMRLVPVFTLETNNQTNNECLSKFVQTHNASSSIKTAIAEQNRYNKSTLNTDNIYHKNILNSYAV